MNFGFLLREEVAPPPKKLKAAKPIDPVGVPTELPAVSAEDRKDTAALISASLRLASVRNRPARYADFGNMDKGDIAAMIDSVLATALTFEDARARQGFKVESPDPRIEEILGLALERTDLQDKIFDIARDTLKYGDSFVEPVYDKKDLVRVQTYEPAQLNRYQDDKGNLLPGKDSAGFFAAFQQVRDSKVVAGWQPWELVHFKYWPYDRSAYSLKGLLDDLRADWRKLELVEQGMVTARITRAYPRRVHYLDLTNKSPEQQETSLAQYINRMTRKVFGRRSLTQDNLPVVDVAEDLYVGTGYHSDGQGKMVERKNRIETEDPANAGLSDIGDVSYLRQKVFSTVPADVVGIRRNTTGDLDSQDLAFARLLRRLQRQLEIGIRTLLNQQLLAYGIIDGEFNVVFPSVIVGAAWKHADARFKDSLTLRNFLEMGIIPRRFALKRIYGMNDAEIDLLFEQIQEEAESPVFQSVFLPLRNGLPNTGGIQGIEPGKLSASDRNSPNTPASDIGGTRGKVGKNSLPTAPNAGVQARIDTKRLNSITNTGINRGTKLGKRLRGNFGG